MPGPHYAFGPFRYDAGLMQLARAGEHLPLGRRAGLLLGTLLARRGDIVTKDELLEAAWPDEMVEESNLSVQISQLRRLLGGDWIRTIERVGYRFVMPQPLDGSPGRSFVPSLVLIGRDRAVEALAAELVAALVRFRALRVMPLQLARQTIAARELGADYVLSLVPQRRGGVLLSLIDGTNGMVLWGERFDRAADELRRDRMAATIESEVQAAETVRGRRDDSSAAEAHWLYLLGRRALTSSQAADNHIAFGHFMAAVERQPDNATYLAAATEAVHHRLSVGWESFGADDKQLCRELAYRTIAVAGNDATALALAGNGLFTADEEDLGLALCRRALAMNPASQLVLACNLHAERWGGSMEESEAISRRAANLAPNDPSQRFALGGIATVASWRGDFATAVEFGRRSIAFGPGYVSGHYSIVEGLIGLGRHDEAERQLARYLTLSPGVTIARYDRGQHHADRSRLAPRLDSLRRAGMPER